MLVKVLGQMNIGGDERKAEILARIGTVLENEFEDSINFENEQAI